MKFKVTVVEAITEEIEIGFPIYRQLGKGNFYRCLSETDVLNVSHYSDTDYAITKNNYLCEGNVFSVNSKEITEIEFLDKFDEVLLKLKNLI